MENKSLDFDIAFKSFLVLIKKQSDNQIESYDKILNLSTSTPKHTFTHKVGSKFITVFMHDMRDSYKQYLINKKTGEILKKVGKEKVVLGSVYNLDQYLLDSKELPKYFCY